MEPTSSSCLHVVGPSNFNAFAPFSKENERSFQQVNPFPAPAGSKHPIPLWEASAMPMGEFERSWEVGCSCRHAKPVKNRAPEQF